MTETSRLVMKRPDRRMKLGFFVQAAGHHVAGWRRPDAQSGGEHLPLMRQLALTAERGKFDMIFLGDGLATSDDAHPSVIARFEPLTLLSALAMTTSKVGLAATASTTYSDPISIARAFASLDHLSGGRAAWNVVTSYSDSAALNFGQASPMPHELRYERAGAFVAEVKRLWPRTPQGRPVVIQAGSSADGQRLAAREAEVVFTAQQSLGEAQAFYRGLKDAAARIGRSPEHVLIMPGVMPVIGATEREAREKLEFLQERIDTEVALNVLSARLGRDLSGCPLDEPLPDLPETDGAKSRARLLTSLARKEQLTLRQLCRLVAGSRGHLLVVGTPEQAADRLEAWLDGWGADGFNIMPPYVPGGLDDFVDQVIPILQERGIYRKEYEGDTLRDHLGLPVSAGRDSAV